MGTEMHAVADVLGFVVDIELAPVGSRGYDDGRREKHLAPLHVYALLLAGKFHGVDLAIVEHFHGVIVEMLTQIVGQLCPGSLGNGDEIFDAYGVFHLSADAAGNERHLQSLACRVDGGRRTGRATAENDHIVFALHGLLTVAQLASEPVFQLLQEHAQVAPADVQLLTVGIDRRHGLNVEAAHLLLEECPVDHLATQPRIDEGHEVEGLHHIGAVGTRERHIGLHPDVALE